MMTSSRPRGTGESFASRRGHGSQLSISDPSHHVTEAIGTLYGDSDDDSSHEPRRDSRPLSFIASPYGGEQIQPPRLPLLHPPSLASPHLEQQERLDERRKIGRTMSDKTPLAEPSALTNGVGGPKKAQTLPARKSSQRNGASFETFLPTMQPTSPLSPTLSLRDVQADAQNSSQFPLTNIDNPNDIAQELSNLQALRRMSMDVGNTADPDLMPFQGLSLMAMPSIAPTGEDDEGDPSRLLWVPAKVHPELAPDQFKTFLEKRVQSIKRRSGESLLAADGQQQRGSGDGLRRKKSMLSRQVDSRSVESGLGSEEHSDSGAADWKLQRKPSQASTVHSAPELSLNELVKDPTKVVQKLTQDTQRQVNAGFEKSNLEDDKPILPVPTMGLRRSTRTTYRKGGSLRSGDRFPMSKRAVAVRNVLKNGEKEADEPTRLSSSSDLSPLLGRHVEPSQAEPISPENFSRPARPAVGNQQPFSQDSAVEIAAAPGRLSAETAEDSPARPSATTTGTDEMHNVRKPPRAAMESSTTQRSRPFPQRSSSQHTSHPVLTQTSALIEKQEQVLDEQQQLQQLQPQQPPPRSSKRPSFGRSSQQPSSAAGASATDPAMATSLPVSISNQTLSDMAHHPSALPGSASTRTDSLTFIPTITNDDRKAEKKTRDRDESEGVRSTGWKWFKSDDRERKKREKEREKEREREREKEKEREDQVRKSRARALGERAQLEKSHDGARLDVLQNSIENASPKGRESLVLDREGIEGKLHDEKKKDSNRKASEAKKEKDGFFGSIFGGSRRKESRDSISGKGKQRTASPDPPAPLLRPDIDYPYTRFPIVEERAIYRMAHIKLANPRRDLRSQVLLSNFMYSYLAKVQAMHPQLNVPTSPHQKRQEEERKRREQELQQQQHLEQHMMMQQQQIQGSTDQYGLEYHRAATQYGDMGQHSDDGGAVDYIDDAQIFEYDHGGHQSNDSSQAPNAHQHQSHHLREHADGYDGADQSRTAHGYYDYDQSDEGQHGDDDMW